MEGEISRRDLLRFLAEAGKFAGAARVGTGFVAHEATRRFSEKRAVRRVIPPIYLDRLGPLEAKFKLSSLWETTYAGIVAAFFALRSSCFFSRRGFLKLSFCGGLGALPWIGQQLVKQLPYPYSELDQALLTSPWRSFRRKFSIGYSGEIGKFSRLENLRKTAEENDFSIFSVDIQADRERLSATVLMAEPGVGLELVLPGDLSVEDNSSEQYLAVMPEEFAQDPSNLAWIAAGALSVETMAYGNLYVQDKTSPEALIPYIWYNGLVLPESAEYFDLLKEHFQQVLERSALDEYKQDAAMAPIEYEGRQCFYQSQYGWGVEKGFVGSKEFHRAFDATLNWFGQVVDREGKKRYIFISGDTITKLVTPREVENIFPAVANALGVNPVWVYSADTGASTGIFWRESDGRVVSNSQENLFHTVGGAFVLRRK